MNRSNQRPDTLMQDRKPERRNFLRRTAGPYIGVKSDVRRSSAFKPKPTSSLAEFDAQCQKKTRCTSAASTSPSAASTRGFDEVSALARSEVNRQDRSIKPPFWGATLVNCRRSGVILSLTLGAILVLFAQECSIAETNYKTQVVPDIPHSSLIHSVAFSPDGRQVLSGSEDQTVKLWDVATGRLVRTFTGHTQQVLCVAFSPDGRHVLSGSWDNSLKLWNSATGQIVHTFEGHSRKILSAAFSNDGGYVLSGSLDKTVKLWDARTGKLVRTFEGHTTGVDSVAFSPDGRHVLSGSDILRTLGRYEWTGRPHLHRTS